MEETKENPIWYFSYPADGTTKLFPKGASEINLKEGSVSFPNGDVDKLSVSLEDIGIEEAGALYLYMEKNYKIQFGKLGWINLKQGTHFLNRAHISLFRIDFENASNVNFVIFIDKETEFFYVK